MNVSVRMCVREMQLKFVFFFYHVKFESSRDIKTKLSSLSSIGEEKERVEEEGEGEGGWDLGEPEAVSKLVSMLEGQVSKLDKQLE